MQGVNYQEAMGMKSLKNVNPFSVQKAHKAVRAGQYLRPKQRRIVYTYKGNSHIFATNPSSEERLH